MSEIMAQDTQSASHVRCVALTQEHRGHGVSTAAYYLGRMLVSQGLRVLLIEATGRRARLQSLMAQTSVKNLVLWTPHIVQPHDLQPALERARRETAGRADVLLLDVDAAVLEHANGLDLGIDFVVAVTEPTTAGQAAADHIAEHLRDAQPPHGRVGVVFSRVDAPTAGDLPQQTEHRHLPVIGYYPADYLLASGDAYSLKGGDSSYPHDTYLYALLRLGQKLAQIVPLEKMPHFAPVDQRVPPAEGSEQHLA